MTIEAARPGAGACCRYATLICTALFAASATMARAANWPVDVGGAQLAYAPATLTVTAGDTVTFVNKGGFHNVVADDGSFRCAQGCDGSGGSGDASSVAWSATVTLASPGTIGYHCEIHGAPGLGMFGSITVDPAPLPPPPPPRPGIDTVPGGGTASHLLLAGVLVLGAALSRRRSSRMPD